MGDRQESKDAKGSLLEPDVIVDDAAGRVIGAAIEVHRHLGPGFAESVYEEALAIELELRGIAFARQPEIQIVYKGNHVGFGRPDFVVCERLVVEIKAVGCLLPVHRTQVISYLKAMNNHLGLLLNFGEAVMRKGIKRVVWNGYRDSKSQKQTGDVNKPHEANQSFIVSRSNSSVPLEIVKEDFDAIA